MGKPDTLQQVSSPPFANHPSFGPLGKMAYVAGTPVQRVYVDGKVVSPPGLHGERAGLLRHAERTARHLHGGRRSGGGHHHVGHGRRGHPQAHLAPGREHLRACSPDGRLVAFFSTGKRKGNAAAWSGDDPTAGLFIMPIQRPWLAERISAEVGESLRWEPTASK